jgi:NAD-dependent deacetylase
MFSDSLTSLTSDKLTIPDELIARLQSAQHVIVYTGAGVSAESGIPTFRGDTSALWARYGVEDMATEKGFRRRPNFVWGWYEWRRAQVLQSQPNAAHAAIAALQRLVPKVTVITQNIDDLHERAGSQRVLHLHGSLMAHRCIDCDAPHQLPPAPAARVGEGVRVRPPKCLQCGGLIRPGVVWFGELMPHLQWEASMHATEREACDVFFSVGASLAIYPAAELPFESTRQGAMVIQVNPQATKLDSHTPYNFRGAAGNVMPAIVRACWPRAD